MNEAFQACEALLRKYAPLYLNVGEPVGKERDPDIQSIGPWKAPTSLRTRARMKRLRAKGLTIEQIAKRCGVTWGTACRWSRLGPPYNPIDKSNK